MLFIYLFTFFLNLIRHSSCSDVTLVTECGYAERRPEISSTLFYKDISNVNDEYPTLINIFYNTRGVMTKLSHPRSGYNQMWRSDAYDSLETLAALFTNPRAHTGKGYRTTDNSAQGCTKCGEEKKRGDFSKNQWRKGPGHARCTDCVRNPNEEKIKQNSNTRIEGSTKVEVTRDCIVCDAGCGRSSPTLQCTNCYTVYYCSEVCQRRHRAEHLPDCRDINWMRASNKETPDEILHGSAMAALLAGRSDFEGRLKIAQHYWQYTENWEGAIEVYKSIFDETQDRSPPEQRQVIMGLSRCFYEIGKYDLAIDLGESAIEMNRHFPEVHKYVALSQKALGDIASARTTMKRAVLYETPWDDKNIEANKKMLHEMKCAN